MQPQSPIQQPAPTPTQEAISTATPVAPTTLPPTAKGISKGVIAYVILAIVLGVIFTLTGILGLFIGGAMTTLYSLLLVVICVTWIVSGIMVIVRRQQPDKVTNYIKAISISSIFLMFLYGIVPIILPVDFIPLVLISAVFLTVHGSIIANKTPLK